MTAAATIPFVTLKGGSKFPIMAFGVGTALYKQDCTQQVQQALNVGFRFVDSAEMYANSQFVEPAVTSLAKKEKVFILDKIGTLTEIRKVALEEREKLKIDKFDALLLHSPPRGQDGKPSNVDAWKEMEQLKEEGVADVIGVSNWLASDLEQVTPTQKYPIEINQVEYHPLVASTEKYKRMMEIVKKEKITIMVYSALAPLTKAPSQDTPLHTILQEIADQEESSSKWTPGIVLQKWASQHAATSLGDAIIASTSGKEERLREYLSTFTTRKLTSEEMDKITQAGAKQPLLKAYMKPVFDAGE